MAARTAGQHIVLVFQHRSGVVTVLLTSRGWGGGGWGWGGVGGEGGVGCEGTARWRLIDAEWTSTWREEEGQWWGGVGVGEGRGMMEEVGL